jgi:ketosteroid isomerase-like protein
MKQPEHANPKSTFWISSFVATGLLLVLVVSPIVTAQTSNSTAARLRALEDRAAIEALITSEYSTALDTRNVKAFVALFTEDADFRLLAKQFPPREHKGHAGIEKFMVPPETPPDSDKSPGDMPVSIKHVITNPHVQLDGDRATATSYWTEVGLTKDGSPRIAATGYYSDVLKRDGSGWKFQSRVVFAYDMPVLGAKEPAAPRSASAQR